MKRCRHKLPSPETAGIGYLFDPQTGEVVMTAMERLRDEAERHPNLRPCYLCRGRRGTWNWIYRADCKGCPEAVQSGVENEGH